MTLTHIATVFNLTGVAAVLFLSIVMLWRYPSPFFRSWTTTYGAMFALLSLDLVMGLVGRSDLLSTLHVAMALTTVACLFQVSRELRGRSLDPRVIAAVFLISGTIAGALLAADVPLAIILAPVALLVGLSYLWLGISLIRFGDDGVPAPWVGVPFILMGLLITIYPFLLKTPYFWIGYWITGLMNVLIGVGMALYLLDRAYLRLRSQHEQLVRLDQLKRSFLSTVSHELRTPLTGMIGNLEFLEDGFGGPLTPVQENYLHEVQRGAAQLSELVESLLDTVQIESGTLKVKRETVDLMALLPQARQAMKGFAAQKRLSLELVVQDDLPLVRGDALRISQILNNLLNNAVKFTPEGGCIQITGEAHPEGVCLTVSDTGIGIPPAALPLVFEPFFQVDSALTRQHRGSGLGLPIVKTLVEAMGGTITVESQLGQGSMFRVTLPLAGEAIVQVS